MHLHERDFAKEFVFQASRSGGAGGQNVNKVATKVELKFHVDNSQVLTAEEKTLVHQKLRNRISTEGYLQVVCQEERSQFRNKERCVQRFYELLNQAFTRQKKRTATKPTKGSVRRRLKGKKHQSAKKGNRGFKGED